MSTTNADGPGSTGGTDILDELEWRGLIAQTTDRDALRRELAAGVLTLYCGFDPTGPSLHAGHLIPLLTLRRFQQAGARPVVLAGGATGQIGDPRDVGERTLQSTDTVADWVQRIRGQLERFVEFDGSPTGAVIANNLDWTGSQTVLEFLRDVGKHFSVNVMLARETVKRRLAAEGISYTEFSYLLLQSQDYLHLFRREGCRLQIGGSDQWGNIVGGVELIRRVEGATAHALTVPLITDSEGRKFGKSTGGANIWLDPQMTSPYAWYQYFVNVADADVGRYLRMFTFLPLEEIEQLEKDVAERPHLRAGAAQVGHGADHPRPRRPPDRPGGRGEPGLVRPGGPARSRRPDRRCRARGGSGGDGGPRRPVDDRRSPGGDRPGRQPWSRAAHGGRGWRVRQQRQGHGRPVGAGGAGPAARPMARRPPRQAQRRRRASGAPARVAAHGREQRQRQASDPPQQPPRGACTVLHVARAAVRQTGTAPPARSRSPRQCDTPSEVSAQCGVLSRCGTVRG